MGHRCEAYRALIEEAAGVGGEHAPALGAHLDACAACREFRREREALVGLLGGLKRVTAPDDFEFRLRARIARQRAAEKFWLRRLRFAPGLAAAAVAACLLTAAALYFRAEQNADHSLTERRDAPVAPVSSPDSVGREAPGVAAANAGGQEDGAEEVGVRGQEEPRLSLPVSAAGPGARRSAPRPRRAQREDTFGVREAPGIDGSRGRQLVANFATPTLELRASPETLRVVLRDEHGGARVLPMRSVSFGAQGPVSRDARAVPASYTDKGGVW